MEGARAQEILLWRGRRHVHGASQEVRCTAEQIGEGFFELRVLSGNERVLLEPFEDLGRLLGRAERLRVEFEGCA